MNRPSNHARALVAATLTTLIPLHAVGAAQQADSTSLPATTLSAAGDPIRVEGVLGGALKVRFSADGPKLSVDSLTTVEDSERPPIWGSWTPDLSPERACLDLVPLDFTLKTAVGGEVTTYGAAPARVDLELAERVLTIDYDRPGSESAGVSMTLYDDGPDDAGVVHLLDVREFGRLALRVRGDLDGVSIRLADGELNDRGDSVVAGALDALATAAASSEWRWAVVELDDLDPELDLSSLARLVLGIEPGHAGQLELDQVQLCRARALPDLAEYATVPQARSALWVWHTAAMMDDAAELAGLVELVATQAIDRVLLQIPGALVKGDDPAAIADLRRVVATLKQRGVEVYALDGAPSYALRGEHDYVERIVRAAGEFGTDATDSFDGVQLDVEPYLLQEYRDDRAGVVREYLRMLTVAHRAAAASDLKLEAAIPFWFDSVPVVRELDHLTLFRPLADAVVERTDSIAVMGYRTAADGSNGAVALSENEVRAANRFGKQAWLALETTWLPDEELFRFGSDPIDGWPDAEVFGNVLWVAVSEDASGSFTWHLGNAAALAATAQQAGLQPLRAWPVGGRVVIPASRLTFYDLDVASLHAVAADLSHAYRDFPAFAGIAIHYDRPFRRLIERSAAASGR